MKDNRDRWVRNTSVVSLRNCSWESGRVFVVLDCYHGNESLRFCEVLDEQEAFVWNQVLYLDLMFERNSQQFIWLSFYWESKGVKSGCLSKQVTQKMYFYWLIIVCSKVGFAPSCGHNEELHLQLTIDSLSFAVLLQTKKQRLFFWREAQVRFTLTPDRLVSLRLLVLLFQFPGTMELAFKTKVAPQSKSVIRCWCDQGLLGWSPRLLVSEVSKVLTGHVGSSLSSLSGRIWSLLVLWCFF